MKNLILKTVTVLAFVGFWASIAMMDSENIIPFVIVMFVSLGWLFLFSKANERRIER